MRRLLLLVALLVLPGLTPAGPLTVLAAASLTDAMQELGRAWAAQGHPAPRFVFASSSALARQAEQGAPASLFASADEPWMDYLGQRGLLAPGTRISPLGNRLVLIAPAGAAEVGMVGMVGSGTDLLARLGPQGRIATGDPASVPVGRYAEAALRTLGLWDSLVPRLARAENVRAALLLVERGEAPLGIVYATDAAVSRHVRVVGTFPPGTHPPITYPFAILRGGDNPEARSLLAFLTGPEAAATYRRLGFELRD